MTDWSDIYGSGVDIQLNQYSLMIHKDGYINYTPTTAPAPVFVVIIVVVTQISTRQAYQ